MDKIVLLNGLVGTATEKNEAEKLATDTVVSVNRAEIKTTEVKSHIDPAIADFGGNGLVPG